MARNLEAEREKRNAIKRMKMQNLIKSIPSHRESKQSPQHKALEKKGGFGSDMTDEQKKEHQIKFKRAWNE